MRFGVIATPASRRRGARLLVVLLALCLGACGTVSRDFGTAYRHSDAVAALPAGVQILALQAPQDLALAERVPAQPPSESHAILALSGGGANGAYGAGVIVGWSQSGDRPQFDVVTGVSTGALAAPFAFLGPDWDDELQQVYTDGGTRGLVGWRSLAAFVAPSLFSSRALRELIATHITPEMLRQVAAEHAKGRRLLVVTTNLDAAQPVIWDMGVVATIGGERGLSLFRSILLASASLPGIFPPVLIEGVSPEGIAVQEMHVDGGVNLPFLGVPEALPSLSASTPGGVRRVLYVIVNGQITARYHATAGNLPGILARSFDSWSNASLRSALAENAAYANSVGISVFITTIPASVDASSLDFEPAAMRSLFELGRTRAVTGLVWSRISAPPALTVEQQTGAVAPSVEAIPSR
ncbi:patatin-like phospholipase family protein [Candidatus Viadribacter manganicus]|uniref:patatin-like phospholipase family protein n=1 Tax=Candidatus Viadribacter manganicus TaxID=1759059 RepID=UPI0008364CC7|nr:patatin-like phospholipase family protein [Candidatus Viadribacter manganicus]